MSALSPTSVAAYGGFTSPALPASAPIERTTALLVLEDGYALTGRSYGATGSTTARIVFNTGMTGYQEVLTDPDYGQQIVVMTSPHIGNTGVNDEDGKSDRFCVAGIVVRDPSRRASSWRARRELEAELVAQGIVGICEVDTRALTRHLRDHGTMRAAIFSGDALPDGVAEYPGYAPTEAAIESCLRTMRSASAAPADTTIPSTPQENA
ncbi:hypothetical protein GZ997_01295 [Actinomyces sp. 565]|nr:hypothetical protein [Actinomyces sp. 565]